jgi:hypothetical protein
MDPYLVILGLVFVVGGTYRAIHAFDRTHFHGRPLPSQVVQFNGWFNVSVGAIGIVIGLAAIGLSFFANFF